MKVAKNIKRAKYMVVGGAALLYGASWLAGIWTLVVLGTLVLAGVVAWKLRGASDGTQDAAKTLATLAFAAPINFAALVASRRWGLYAIAAVAALMLLDLSFGDDGLSFPIFGWFWIFVIALGVGGYDWYKKKAPLREQVEEAVRAIVPGFTVAHPPEIAYGEGPLRKTFGKFQPLDTFAFRVPGMVDETSLEDIEIRLRQRLPAAEGSTWAFEWNLRRASCLTRVVPDLPRSIWHPYTDGSHGTPLAPVGDHLRIPLGVTFGGKVIYWEPNESPHCFVVGATGGGKSVLLLGILDHFFLFRDHWELYLIDLKRTELTEYARYPGLIAGIGTTHAQALEILTAAFEEMDRRQDLLDRYEVQDLEQLNAARAARGEEPLKHVCVMADEIGILLAPIKGTPTLNVCDAWVEMA